MSFDSPLPFLKNTRSNSGREGEKNAENLVFQEQWMELPRFM